MGGATLLDPSCERYADTSSSILFQMCFVFDLQVRCFQESMVLDLIQVPFCAVTGMEFCQCKGKILFTKARLIHCLLEIRESLIIIICSIDRMCDVSIDDDEG
jgi:hypothetical protein